MRELTRPISKGTVRLRRNKKSAQYLFLFQHLLLLQRLHRVNFTGVGLLNQSDLRCCQLFEHHEEKRNQSVALTSPNAPLPITLTVRKSSRPSFVRRSLRKVDSFFPCCWSCRCFRSSDIIESVCNRLSSSTRLESHRQWRRMRDRAREEREPCISLDGCVHRYFVIVLEFELSCFSSGHRFIGKASGRSVKVHVVRGFRRLGWRGFRRFDVLSGRRTRQGARGHGHDILNERERISRLSQLLLPFCKRVTALPESGNMREKKSHHLLFTVYTLSLRIGLSVPTEIKRPTKKKAEQKGKEETQRY